MRSFYQFITEARVFVMTDDILAIAQAESRASRAADIMNHDAQGVVVGAARLLDQAVNRGEFSLTDVAADWTRTRAAIAAAYGDPIVLYRADHGARNAATLTVYMGDKALASRFGTAQPHTVALADLIAVYARPSGYYECIVRL